MRRLEYERRTCALPTFGRKTADPAMVLAQVARERRRLGEEHRSLVKRVRRIEARLSEIATAESRLLPKIQLDRHLGGAMPLQS
jgi:hypothetical protein